jgi:hypothetical protein
VNTISGYAMACSAISCICVAMGCDLEVSSIFPSSRTLYPTSPSLRWVAWVSLPHLPRYYCPSDGRRLRLPLALLDALCFRSVIDTLFVPFVRVPFPARQRSGTLALTPGLLGLPVRLFRLSLKETIGSPKFPGYPFELMPCSSTPVVSSALALARFGLLPSATMTTSAFPLFLLTVIHCPQLYNFRGYNHTACFLAPLGFRLPLPDLPARFTTALLARL